jgi:hypothetical protein
VRAASGAGARGASAALQVRRLELLQREAAAFREAAAMATASVGEPDTQREAAPFREEDVTMAAAPVGEPDACDAVPPAPARLGDVVEAMRPAYANASAAARLAMGRRVN